MIVYRIAKSELRARDISGIGAFSNGGRWNNKSTYMLYTSINSSLAYLENLVHFDELDLPPDLYISFINIQADENMVYQLPDNDYPNSWQLLDNLENKRIGDLWMLEKKHLALKVRSAVNPSEYNFLLNPLYPNYHDLVKVDSVEPLKIDARLTRNRS
ncbi:MAG: RES family NAD+ phosphorylase [Sphingobacteriales bacterium]